MYSLAAATNLLSKCLLRGRSSVNCAVVAFLLSRRWAATVQYSIIRLSQCSEEERAATGSDDRQLMIGAASESDLRLHVSFGLPDECLRIRVEKGLCVAENLTGDPGLIFVNGQQVFGIMQLDDGDALQIGSDQFAVVFEKEERTPELVEASTPASDATTIADAEDVLSETSPAADVPHFRKMVALETRVLNAAVTLHQLENEERFETNVLPALCKTHDAFLVVNFKTGGLDNPGIRVAGEDLLESLPETIRKYESLHAVIHSDAQRKLELGRRLNGRDAAIWCVPGEDIQSCVLDIKLYAAWFVRPTVLQAALQNSSTDFCERLLRSFRMLLLRGAGDDDRWFLYSKPDVELDFSGDDSLFAVV